MRRFLSPQTRRPTPSSRTARRTRLGLELLEDRLAPAATSLYVTTQMVTADGSLFKEYTPTGTLIRSVSVPTAGGTEFARDLAFNGRQPLVYNGTFSPQLSAYDAAAGTWSNTAGPAGWSTVNNASYGGLAVLGGSAFATDMNTVGAEAQGVVRFDLNGGTSDRFATDFQPIDVAAGLDGKLYALDANRTVRVYDPSSLALLNTVTLPATVAVSGAQVPQDYRAVAVDPNGLIYAADWGRTLTRFSAAGVAQLSVTLPTTSSQGLPVAGNLDDLDFFSYPTPNDGGLLAVGSNNGVVTEVSGQFFTLRTAFTAGAGPTFVTGGPALAELSINSVTVTEGSAGQNTPATFTVTLSNPVAQPVTVNWNTLGGSATPGQDFVTASGNLTFAPGETSKTVTVTVLDDNNDELNETFYVSLSYAAGAPSGAVIANSTGTGTIVDDDPLATNVAVAAGSAANVYDSNGDGVFETAQVTTGTLEPYHNTASYEKRTVMEFDATGVNLNAAPYVTLDLYIELPWYQSTQARVYAYPGNGTAELADATQTGVQVGTIANLTNSSGGTAWRRITLDRNALASILSQSSVVGILITADAPTFFDIHGTASAEAPKLKFWNSQPPTLPVLNVSNNYDYEKDPGAAPHYVNFAVSMTTASPVPISVDYQTISYANGATPGVDYVPTSGTLTFAPGETLKTVPVQVLDDLQYEPTEYFYLQLSNPTYASLYNLSGAGTIYDNDPVPLISTSAVTVTEPDTGSVPAAFTVSLSNPSYQTITVNYATSDGTATAGSDYTAASGKLTFAPGETSKTVNVSVLGDSTFEQNEAFNFALTSPTNANLANPPVVTGTILDNDPLPQISVAPASTVEGNSGTTPLTFTVSLSNPSAFPVNVNYFTQNGSAFAGFDYTAVSGTLTFAPGVTSKTVTVSVLGNTMYQPDKTFTFGLGSPNGAVFGTQYATGTIVNDDPVPTVSVNSPSVSEGGPGDLTQMVFTVALSNPNFQPIVVQYMTADGTALAPYDYYNTSGTVTFAPGETSKTVAVTVTGDSWYEPNETLQLNVTDTNGNPLASGTGTIVNDDPLPTVNVTPGSVQEGNSGLVALPFTVSLSNPSSQTVSVDYATADGTATAGSDYYPAAGTLTFDPGVTSASFIVSVIGDLVYEPDETLSVVLSNAQNATAGPAGTGTIVNDDPGPGLSVSSPTVTEGDSGTTSLTFTVTLLGAGAQPVTVTYATADGTATAGTDYTAASGTLTFAPGETTKTVTVSVNGDTTYEPNEALTLNFSDSNGKPLASGTGTVVNDDPLPSISVAGAAVFEGNFGTTPLDFTVSLTNPSSQEITVDYTTANGTATAGSDYTAAAGTVTFAPGQTSATAEVYVTGDTTVEPNETLTLQLTNAVNATLAAASATGTIVNDDQSLAVSSPSVAEGDSGTTALVFTVTLSGSSPQPVTVNYTTADVSTTVGNDYTAAAGTLTFAPGETSKTVTVSVIGDTTYEPDETMTLSLTDSSGSILASGTGTIVNDDPRPTISVTGSSVAEGNSGTAPLAFTISLSNRSYQAISIDYTTLDGTATAGSDYIAASGTITFVPGSTSETVVIAVFGDTTYEPDETLTLRLANPVNATLATASATGTIVNDDLGATVSSPSVAEGNSHTTALTYTVTLSGAGAQPVTVNYATADGTATAGSDYTAASGTLTFAPGETTKTVTVSVNGDTTYEPNETLTLAATDSGGNALASGTGTITNDDALPAISVGGATVSEGNSGTTPLTFVVGLSNPSYQTITVDYATADGTATAGSDYTAASGTLTFAPGETSKNITVSVLGDLVYEPVETFTLQLANAGNATLAAGTATGTIANDDPAPTVSVSSPSVGEGNSGTALLTFAVTLSNPSSQAVVVNYATADGTATAGSDYTTASGALTFAPGETSKSVVVSVSGDTAYEPDETLTLRVTDTGGNALASGTGTITNDDSQPAISVAGASVNEGNGGTTALTFTVSLSNPSYQTVTVNYATADGTATAGSDYTAASGTLTFAPGQARATVTVSVTGDTTFEPDETLTLGLTNGVNASLAVSSATGTIANDDPVPTVTITPPSVSEGDSGQTNAVFTVTLSNPSYQTITVNYRTADGTATAGGADYITQSGTLTFAPGETTKTVAVVVRGDLTHEGNETFALVVSDTLGNPLATGTATILDDDPVPAVHISTGSVYEGNSGTTPMAFVVTLTNPTTDTVTVNYATADDTATAGSDYTATSGTLTFAPGETGKQILVSVIGDRVYEGTEQFVVKLSGPTNATLADTQADGIIADDDFPTVTAASASVAEGDSGTTPLSFTVSLSNPSVQPVTVNYATANGTALAGSDFTAASGSVTFAPGQTTATVVIAVLGDTYLEPDETFTMVLTLPNGTNATLGTTSVTGTIQNDDYAPVANAGPDQTANEGAAVAFDASHSVDADNDPLTFTWDFGDGGTGSGVTPSHAYTDDGVYTVTLTANDGHGGVSTDTALVTVRNVAPAAALSGPASGVRGQARAFTFTASDPSPVDQAAGFTYRVTWGDGTTDIASGPGSGVTLTHVFAAAGTFNVSVTATDRNAGQGAAASAGIAVKAVELQGADLVVGGTTGADHITLSPANTAGGVRVLIAGQDLGTFTPTGQIVVYAQAGDDVVDFATLKVGKTVYEVGRPLLLLGGDGNDTLDARNANAAGVLLGGAGNDTLYGGAGRELLIGGAGSDSVTGGNADDIVIGGTTAYDDDLAALAALRAEWARTDADYATRLAHLRDGSAGGLNGPYLLNGNTVQDDGALDTLYGGGGQDWFFSGLSDKVNDGKRNETVTKL